MLSDANATVIRSSESRGARLVVLRLVRAETLAGHEHRGLIRTQRTLRRREAQRRDRVRRWQGGHADVRLRGHRGGLHARIAAQPAVELRSARDALQARVLDEAAHATHVHLPDLHAVVRGLVARAVDLAVAEAELKPATARELEALEAEHLIPRKAHLRRRQERARATRVRVVL